MDEVKPPRVEVNGSEEIPVRTYIVGAEVVQAPDWRPHKASFRARGCCPCEARGEILKSLEPTGVGIFEWAGWREIEP